MADNIRIVHDALGLATIPAQSPGLGSHGTSLHSARSVALAHPGHVWHIMPGNHHVMTVMVPGLRTHVIACDGEGGLTQPEPLAPALATIDGHGHDAAIVAYLDKLDRDAIERLKADWLRDPCWDIEVTAGFEAHHHELLAFRLERELDIARTEVARLRVELSRQHPTRRIFEFSTGDEVDVDSYATLDANGQNSAALFQLRRGGFLRVHFASDRERAAELQRMKQFRLDASEGP